MGTERWPSSTVVERRWQSSHLLDVTAKYPELDEFADSVNADSAIIDGELVVLDDDGRPSFELMQQHATQVAFYAFDVLSVNGHDTTGLPYEGRRELLGGLLEAGTNWMVPAHRIGDGAALISATIERGLEGVMAKRLGSVYLPGKRSPNWRKVKNRRTVEVVIGGYTPGAGNRAGTFGALLVGVAEVDGLRFAGGVGTGFSHRTLTELSHKLGSRRSETSPFITLPPREYSRDAIWVRPDLRAERRNRRIHQRGIRAPLEFHRSDRLSRCRRVTMPRRSITPTRCRNGETSS